MSRLGAACTRFTKSNVIYLAGANAYHSLSTAGLSAGACSQTDSGSQGREIPIIAKSEKNTERK